MAWVRFNLDKYCAAKHALLSVIGGGFQGPVDSHLTASGLTRDVVASVPTFLAGIELVRQSDLLVSIPHRLAQTYRASVVSRSLPFPSPTFDVTLVWHARTDGSRPHAWFRSLIRK
jgi:LysR family transcriptional regulator, mexEF-oprN operon transcriptional activator